MNLLKIKNINCRNGELRHRNGPREKHLARGNLCYSVWRKPPWFLSLHKCVPHSQFCFLVQCFAAFFILKEYHIYILYKNIKTIFLQYTGVNDNAHIRGDMSKSFDHPRSYQAFPRTEEFLISASLWLAHGVPLGHSHWLGGQPWGWGGVYLVETRS